MSSIQDQQLFARNSAKRRSLQQQPQQQQQQQQQKQQQQQQQQQLLSRHKGSGPTVQLQSVIDMKLLEQGSIRMCRLSSNSRPSSVSRPRSSSKPKMSISGGSITQRRLQSAGDTGSQSKRKGRLGNLITAVSEAHGAAGEDSKYHDGQKSRDTSSCEPVDIEVFLCDKCDRMFCHAEEMQKHCFSCEQLA